MPGYFRFLTLMAFHVFLQEKVCMAPSPKPCVPDLGKGNLSRLRAPMRCPGAPVPPAMPCDPLQVDLAVLEVGIGGAYDCTNIIR